MHVGILGSGQLARMLAEAGRKLNHSFTFVAESEEAARPVIGFGDVVYTDRNESCEQLYVRMGKPAVVTVESENVDVGLLQSLESLCRVYPSSHAVSVCQNRKKEKIFLNDQYLPTVNFRVATSLYEIECAVRELSFNVIIKSCEQGYDGKNQWRIASEQEWQQFALNYVAENEVVVEACVCFSHEVSIIAARSELGDVRFYPLTENRHKNGVLVTSCIAVDKILVGLENSAKSYLQTVVNHFDYVGVIAMECFVVDGQLIVNELAPRVHNSGHWTQQGCAASQFENHIRAITGMRLGDTHALGPTAMLNLLGKGVNLHDICLPGATLHWYNKTCKPGRKVGHVNLQDTSNERLIERLYEFEQQVYAKGRV